MIGVGPWVRSGGAPLHLARFIVPAYASVSQAEAVLLHPLTVVETIADVLRRTVEELTDGR